MASTPIYRLIGRDGKIYPIGPKGLTLGSRPGNDIVLGDGRASLWHARILLASGRCWIRDENGTLGTMVNGKKVEGQQELRPGDQLKIGLVVFRLAAVTSVDDRKRKGISILGFASAFIFLLILILGSGGFFSSGLPAATPSVTLETLQTKAVAFTLDTLSLPTVTASPIATDSSAPSFNAGITCDGLDQAQDLHTCTVTNLGSVPDTLWLAFRPFRLARDNHFNLSVLMDGEDILPDRKGMLSLGSFEPGASKTITLRMICVEVNQGCPLTTVHAQVYVNDRIQAISGREGEFDLKNSAAGLPSTPSRKQQDSRSNPTSIPITPLPASTSTPSDAYGPTATPD